MRNEFEGTQEIRQALEQSAQCLDTDIAKRLVDARNQALSIQKPSAAKLSLAGGFANIGLSIGSLLPHVRAFVALTALTLGIVSTYYWNAFEQADENEEVDSALLGDELPVAAYTDQGFEAWLDHTSQSSAR